MRILVSGTREGIDHTVVKTIFDFIVTYYMNEEFTLIHGTAKGVDTQCANYAKTLGWQIEAFKPNWSIGKHAGFIYQDMVDASPDFGIFIPGPTSRGTVKDGLCSTYDCLEKYKLLKKPYILYDFNNRLFSLED